MDQAPSVLPTARTGWDTRCTVRPEILSTSRPGRLRLAGFLALVVGAVLAGVGASMTWATVGFPSDTAGAADVAVKGLDVWEGVAALAIAAVALVATVVMRLVASTSGRRGIAAAVLLGGLVVGGLATADVARAESRFGGREGLDEMAQRLAAQRGLPVDRVRTQLERSFGAQLRVDVGGGLYATLAGGIAIALAGGLALPWAGRRRRDAPGVQDEAPA